MIALLTVLLALQSANAKQPPTQACFELLADSEGELALAKDPAWRCKAIGKLAEMRAEHDRYRASVDHALARNAKVRDQLQRSFDRREVEEDDFNAARSAFDTEAQRLIAERDTPQLPIAAFDGGADRRGADWYAEPQRPPHDLCQRSGKIIPLAKQWKFARFRCPEI